MEEVTPGREELVVETARALLDREMRRANRPIWLEAGAVVEWAMLHTAPVYYGIGVPPGDGSGVILVPGFLGTDLYLWELNRWLRRIGYRPFMSEIGRNADCLDVLVERLRQTVLRVAMETGRRVHLVGHSLGGILARAVTVQTPDQVESLVTLGSPFRGICAHPLVFVTMDRVRKSVRRRRANELEEGCFTSVCNCPAVSSLGNALPVGSVGMPDHPGREIRHLAIYTRSDGIVDWQVCTHDDAAANVEVRGSHIGLVCNHQVYQVLARHLFTQGNQISPAAP
jgi:triacylglycerol lipase